MGNIFCQNCGSDNETASTYKVKVKPGERVTVQTVEIE